MRNLYDPYSDWEDLYDDVDVHENKEEKKDVKSNSFDYGTYYRSKKSYKSSLGWGSSRLSNASSYTYTSRYNTNNYLKGISSSTASAEEKEAEILLKRAYSSVRDIIVILDFPKIVDIHLTGKSIVPSDRSRIFVSTNVIDSHKSDEEKISVLCGTGAHEAAHLLFTEYRTVKEFEDKLNHDEFGKIAHNYRHLVLSIFNMIEDERVEDRLLSERPGYSELIEAAKEFSLETVISNSIWKREEEFYKFLRTFYGLLRYPDLVDNDTYNKYLDTFKIIRKFLNPLPETTKETCVTAINIFNTIISVIGDLDGCEQNGDITDMNYLGGTSNILYGFDKDGYNNPDLSRISDTIQKSNIIEDLLSGNLERGVQENSFFKKVKGNLGMYNFYAERIREFVPAIQKLVRASDKNYDYLIPGCRSGVLDTNKLAEAYQGVPQVYVRNAQVRTSKSTICIVIDESGSMYDQKIKLAREAAILLNEAFKNLTGVDLYIYGHTADTTCYGSTDINIYREGRNVFDQWGLSQVAERCNNRDGIALFDIAKRVKSKMTTSEATMFVISDGQPNARGYTGQCAVNDTKQKVDKIENMGISVIQIGIDAVAYADQMFTKRIDLKNSVAELPQKLGKIVKEAVLKSKKTTTI